MGLTAETESPAPVRRLSGPEPPLHQRLTVIAVHSEVPAETSAKWHQHWLLKNTDWPALALNLVVLTLAIVGTLQALDANRRSKETERKLFRESRFRHHEEAFWNPRRDLQTVCELADELTARSLSEADFHREVDQMGTMLLPALLAYRRELRSVDNQSEFGQGWLAKFQPFDAAVTAAFDRAHDATLPIAQRKLAADELAGQLKTSLLTMTEYEFDQRQTWGKPLNA